MLDGQFPAQRWYRQRRYLGSALWAEESAEGFEAFSADAEGAAPALLPVPLYFVVIAARAEPDLPPQRPTLSLLSDRGDREWKRIDSFFDCGPLEEIYIVRTDSSGTGYVQFGDGETGARLPSGLQNVTAIYRTGNGAHARWWVALPWLRLRLLWKRVAG